MRKLALQFSLFTLLVPASVGLASDGVLEINQACAVNTGCFSGDAAGLPVTITAAGSYRLTSNLVVPDVNTDGILVSANDVGIDLNNFAIIRSGCEVSCIATSGDGRGIELDLNAGSLSGISVKNGSVIGTGDTGVWVGKNSAVSNVTARWCGDEGIFASYGSTVSGNIAYENGGLGIYAGEGSTISGNTAYGNGGDGISAQTGSTVSSNSTYSNGNDGIFAETGSTVSGNAARGNDRDGIHVAAGSMVSGNTAYDNDRDGIHASSGSTVSSNTMRQNTGYGLRFSGTESAYSENVISNNTAGTVTGSAIQLGQNACEGNTTCP